MIQLISINYTIQIFLVFQHNQFHSGMNDPKGEML